MDRSPRHTREPGPLDPDSFEEAVGSLIEAAEKHAGDNWRGARQDGWRRFNGHVDAKAEEGGDLTVSYEIRDAVQQVLPEIMEQLAGSDEPVEYYSHDLNRVELCRQATLYAQSLWWEGGGWEAIHDSVLHAAVGRLGVFKVHRLQKLCMEEQPFERIPPELLALLQQQPGVTVADVQHQEEQVRNEATGQMQPVIAHSSGTARRYYVDETLEIGAVDPATFICTSAQIVDDALLIGEKNTVRMADLRAMGFEPEELADLDGQDDSEQREERATRTGETAEERDDYGTWALKSIDLYEVHVKLDADGDGLLERYKVIAAGSDKRVLRVDRADDQPYVTFPFRRSPHTMAGLSVPDLLQDVQEARTKLTRALLDNVDLVNSPMILGSGTVNWTQLQTWKRRKVINEGVPNAIRWFSPPPTAAETLPVLDWLTGLTESRIGVSRTAQGLQPDSLTSISAIAVAGAQQAAQRAIRLTVRTIAESGLRPAYQKLLRLMVGMAPRAVVGEDGSHQVVDPRKFDPMWGVRTRVGLGAMASDQRKQGFAQAIALTQGIVSTMGVDNHLTDPPRQAALVQAAMAEFKGLGLGRFFKSPQEAAQHAQQQAQQGPPPDPKMIEAQGKLQIEGQKAQAGMALDQAKAQHAAQMQAAKVQADAWAQLQKIQADYQAKMAELAAEIPLEKYKVDHQARSGQGNIPRPR